MFDLMLGHHGSRTAGNGEENVMKITSLIVISMCKFRQTSGNVTMHNSLILVGKELRDTEGIFCLLLDLFSVMTHSVSG